MKKKLIILGLILLVVVGYFIFQPKQSGSNKPVIKIGMIGPLTGNLAHWGDAMKKGLLFAEKRMDESNNKYQYELIFEDNQGKPALTASLAHKLLDVDKVEAIVSVFTPMTKIISPIVEEKKKIYFGSTWMNELAAPKHTFLHWPLIKKEANLLAEEIVARGYKRPAIFTLNHKGFDKGLKELRSALKAKGLPFVFEERVNSGTRDFKSAILKAKQNQPDLYIMNLFPPELGIVIKQLKETVEKPAITGLELHEYELNWESINGTFFSGPVYPEEAFMKAWEEHFGDARLPLAPQYYDIFNILVYGFENTPGTGGMPIIDDVIKAIKARKTFKGSFGMMKMQSDGFVDSPVAIMEMRDGKPVVIRKEK